MKAFTKILKTLGALAVLATAGLCHAENITHSTFGKIEQWHIAEPRVTVSDYTYFQILVRPGDSVLVTAGGCVQTGGQGKTWKRYVDPQGPNSDRYYHGLIKFSLLNDGVSLVRLKDGTLNNPIAVQTFGVLQLGYEDTGYSDNGYYSHDNGTGDQCKDVENAWVHLTVIHQ